MGSAESTPEQIKQDSLKEANIIIDDSQTIIDKITSLPRTSFSESEMISDANNALKSARDAIKSATEVYELISLSSFSTSKPYEIVDKNILECSRKSLHNAQYIYDKLISTPLETLQPISMEPVSMEPVYWEQVKQVYPMNIDYTIDFIHVPVPRQQRQRQRQRQQQQQQQHYYDAGTEDILQLMRSRGYNNNVIDNSCVLSNVIDNGDIYNIENLAKPRY
jgi:hypothetical protein